MPVEVAWDLLALGADTAAALIFYWCYRQYNAEYDQIKVNRTEPWLLA